MKLNSRKSAEKKFTDDCTGTASFWLVDRTAESDRLLELIDSNPGKPVFVHGRRSVGKTSLLRLHVARRLAEKNDPRTVAFGRLNAKDEVHIERDGEVQPLQQIVTEPLLICVDQLRQILTSGTARQAAFLDRVRAITESDECRATIVFLLDDEDFGGLMAMSGLRPDFVKLIFQVRGINIPEAVRGILAAVEGTDDWVDSNLLDRVARDAVDLLPDRELATSPRIPAIVAAQLLQMREGSPENAVSVKQYVEGGRLLGMLERFVKGELKRLAELNKESLTDFERILDELVVAEPLSGISDIDSLAARIGVSLDKCTDMLDTLVSASGLVQKPEDGRYLLEPIQLHTALRVMTRRRRQQMNSLQIEIHEYAESGLTHGTSLPLDVLKQALNHQYDLRLDQRATLFVLDWVLRTKSCSLEVAKYWLGRIGDADMRLGVLSNSAFDRDPDARLKATRLLREYGVPEACDILVKLAIQDAEAEIRSSALQELAEEDDPTIRERIQKAALLDGSTYRVNAINALGIYRDDETAELLLRIIATSKDSAVVQAAIQILSTIPTASAVHGVVGIALEDPSNKRRGLAVDALRNVTNPAHIDSVVDSVSSWKGPDRDREESPGGLWPFLKAAGRIALAPLGLILNLFIPGILLLLARRYKAGSVFGLLGLAAWIGLMTARTNYLEAIWAIGLFGLIVISLVWTGLSLLNASDQAKWRLSDLRSIVRLEVFVGMVIAAAAWDILFWMGSSIVPAPHGIFHLLTRQWRPALLIFFLQVLSLGAWLVGEYHLGIIYPETTYWLGVPLAKFNTVASTAFLITAYGLFIGTFLWDVLGTSFGRILFAAYITRRKRRRDLIRGLLSKDAYATRLAKVVADKDANASTRAAKLLVAHGDVIPPRALLAHGETHHKKLEKTLPKSLSKVADPAGIQELSNFLKNSATKTQSLVVRALAKRPTRQSLQALEAMPRRLPAKYRRRLRLAKMRYATGLVTTPVGILITVMSALFGFMILEGSGSPGDPYRPLEKYIILNCDRHTWPPNAQPGPIEMREHRREWVEKRASVALNLAEMMADSEHIDRMVANLAHAHRNPCDKDLPNNQLVFKLATFEGLAYLAKTKPSEPRLYEPDIATFFLGLEPTPLVTEGLANPDESIRRSAIAALGRLLEVEYLVKNAALDSAPSKLQRQMMPVRDDADAGDGIFSSDMRSLLADSLGIALLDRNLSAGVRQSIIEQLRRIGGPRSVDVLKEFVMDSDSLYANFRRPSNFLSGDVPSGLGISGQLADDEVLAEQSVEVIGRLCAENSQSALEEIGSEKIGSKRLQDAVLRGKNLCIPLDEIVNNPEVLKSDEIKSLRANFEDGNFAQVASTAEQWLQKLESPALLVLAGRANYALATEELNIEKKLQYWMSAEGFLDPYVRQYLADHDGVDGDAVLELARTRLGIARYFMDQGWRNSESAARAQEEFEKALSYLNNVDDVDPTVPDEPNFRSLFEYVADKELVSQDDYNNAMSRVWAFKAAALIDGDIVEYSQAQQLLVDALELDSSFAWARYLQAVTYWATERYDLALAKCRESLLGGDSYSGNPSYELPFRLIFQMRESIDAAAELEELSARVGDSSPWPHYYLYLLYQDFMIEGRATADVFEGFETAYEAITRYSKMVDEGNDPWINLGLLETAITSENLDAPEIEEAERVIRTQMASYGDLQAVSFYLLTLRELLLANQVTFDAKELSELETSTELLDELLGAYEKIRIGTASTWIANGIRFYLKNCEMVGSCELNEATTRNLDEVAAILEQDKSEESFDKLKIAVRRLQDAKINVAKANLGK